MSRTPQYPVPWLDCRYPFDASGRNKNLVGILMDALHQQSDIHILDLGAGNGSNYRYYNEKLPSGCRWTCLERDELLVEELQQLGNHVKPVKGSVGDLTQLVDLSQVDLVLANALFDLFSEEQFRDTLTPIIHGNIPFFFTLNYKSMAFHPFHPLDSQITSLYHRHMRREQDFGRAMGEEGPEKMSKVLKGLGASDMRYGESIWQVNPSDSQMLEYLIFFIGEAVPELALSSQELLDLEEWIKTRKTQLDNQLLSVKVYHEDLLWLGRPK